MTENTADQRVWASPTVVGLRHAVRATVPADTTRVVVGCSGGPDSLVLTAIAAWVGERHGFAVHAVTVDHQLQNNSGEVAATAARNAIALGATSAEVVAVEVSGEGGVEAAARHARRAALLETSQGAPILLGHTATDQAETVLLRLLRGAGTHSLSAMAAVDPPWYRPFLTVPRADIVTAVQELLIPLGITPWSDPHNADADFARVRMRDHLQRLTEDFGTGLVAGLVRTADLARADDLALESFAEAFLAEHPSVTGPSAAIQSDYQISIADLAHLPAAIRTRVIRRVYGIVAGVDRESSPLTFQHVQSIDSLISEWHGQGEIAVPLGVSAVREYDRLRIYRTATT